MPPAIRLPWPVSRPMGALWWMRTSAPGACHTLLEVALQGLARLASQAPGFIATKSNSPSFPGGSFSRPPRKEDRVWSGEDGWQECWGKAAAVPEAQRAPSGTLHT